MCAGAVANFLKTCYGFHIDMSAVKVSPKFQVVIPRAVRDRLCIKAGDELRVVALNQRIEMVHLKKPKALRGFVRGIDTSVERERGERV